MKVKKILVTFMNSMKGKKKNKEEIYKEMETFLQKRKHELQKQQDKGKTKTNKGCKISTELKIIKVKEKKLKKLMEDLKKEDKK